MDQSQAGCRFIARQIAGINPRRLFGRQAREACLNLRKRLTDNCQRTGVEGAYRRSDMLERRRAIMQASSNFIVGP
jgi:hypothetical protein